MKIKESLSVDIFSMGDAQIEKESLVGPKAASLFLLYKHAPKNVYKPQTFVISATLYRNMIQRSGVLEKIKAWATAHEGYDEKQAKQAALEIRKAIVGIEFTEKEQEQLGACFDKMSKKGPLMVRSSATIENLPGKSFAGQHDSFSFITTKKDFFTVIKQCMASLFADRAISYRDAHGFDHKSTAMAILVQEMIPASNVLSGISYSFDPETFVDSVGLITASYGFGDAQAQGKVVPDRFMVFLEALEKKKQAIIQRTLGKKQVQVIPRARKGVKQTSVSATKRNSFSLSDQQVVIMGNIINALKKEYTKPFECEWAWHAKKEKFALVQIRFHEPAKQTPHTIYQYELKRQGMELGRGTAVGHGIASGTVCIVNSQADLAKIKPGDILVAKHTDPAWSQVMKKVHAIITEEGGKSSHAATAARELRVPAIVGLKDARSLLKNRQRVTVHCAAGDNGLLYKGLLPYERQEVVFDKLPKTKTQLTVRMQDPDHAFAWGRLPKDGFGIIDQADIVAHVLRIHPLALLEYAKVKGAAKKQITNITRGYRSKRKYAKEKLAEGIARLAVAGYDKPVYLKLSDYRSDQYKDIIGASHASAYMRKSLSSVDLYQDSAFKKAFALECEAIAMVREQWGLDNVVPVVPFCRTPEEAKEVLALMKTYGLERGKQGLQVHVLCDLPSNVVLAEEFAQLFDGVSIQADALTTAALGVEKGVAIEKSKELGAAMLGNLIDTVVKKAHHEHAVVHVFGQLLEEEPTFLDAVVKSRVDGISVHPDALVDAKKRVAMVEGTVGRTGKKTHKGFLSLVLVFGFLGAGIVSIGAGCGEVQKNPLPDTIAAEHVTPAQIREEAMKQVAVALEERESEYADEKRTLQIQSFANFSLDYPAAWEVTHWNGGLTIAHPTSTQVVSIYEPLIAMSYDSLPNEQAIIGGKVWTKYTTEKAAIATYGDELVIEGSGKGFKDVIESFAFINDDTIVDRPLTHWDIREKRICAQVITFAQAGEGEQCEMFSSPCEVPAEYSICEQG